MPLQFWDGFCLRATYLDFVDSLTLFSKELPFQTFAAICLFWWNLWCARNKLIFANEPFKKENVLASAVNGIKSWASRSQQSPDDCLSFQAPPPPKVSSIQKDIYWSWPETGWSKLNFYGSKLSNGNAAS